MTEEERIERLACEWLDFIYDYEMRQAEVPANG